MEKLVCNADVNEINESIIDELQTVESLLKLTVESCLNKECNSEYYANDSTAQISAERNKYISTLLLALERLKHVQALNCEIEDLIIKSSMENLKKHK